jgi:hypothetical protein
MRAAGFGACTTQAFAAEGLDSDDCADHVAVDIDVADVRLRGELLGSAVDTGLNA